MVLSSFDGFQTFAVTTKQLRIGNVSKIIISIGIITNRFEINKSFKQILRHF